MSQHSGKSVPLETPLAAACLFAPVTDGLGAKPRFWHLEIGRSVRMRRWMVSIMVLMGLLAAGVFGFSKWPVYTAQSQVFLPPPSAATGHRWPYDSTEYDAFLQRQMQSVSNLDMQINTLRKLGPGAWQRGDENEPSAAQRLGRALSVQRQGTGYQLTVTARAGDAGLAARVANAAASTMVENLQREQQAALQTQGRTSGAAAKQSESPAPDSTYLMAAEQPLHPDYLYLLGWTLSLALGGVLLGLLAAVLTRKLDPRIYTAGDLLRVADQLPIAQLPDFDQVSRQVEEHYLLRLAAAIDHACLRGGLQNCLFTGVAPGVGVTTIADRMQVLLETMGQSAVLVDSLESYSRDSQPIEEKKLLLADTAPLLISNRTESMARSAEAILVVVESGVTTRAQLAAVIRAVERMRGPEVGFVLNRVRLEKADSAFRRQVRRMEDDVSVLSSEPKTERRRTAVSRRVAPRRAEDLAVLRPVSNASESSYAKKPPVPVERRSDPLIVDAPEFLVAASATPPHSMGQAAPATPPRELKPAVPQPPVRPAQPRQPQVAAGYSRHRPSSNVAWERVAQSAPAPTPRIEALASQEPAATPVSPTVAENLPAQDYSASAAPPSWVSAYRMQTAVSDLPPAPNRSSAPSRELVAPSLPRREEPTQYMGSVGQDSGSRLSALRDFSAGLKNLRRRAEDFSNPSASSFAEEYTPAVRQVAVEPVEMPALPELSAGESLPSRRVITAPQILPPKIAGERADSPRTGTSTRRDRRRSVDNVEILPSRRGQYKKK